MKSVERFNSAPVKYIVVDNGSDKPGVVGNLAGKLHQLFGDEYLRIDEGPELPDDLPKMTFLVSKSNSGYASGNNKGLDLAYRYSDIDKVMILNSDILFVEDIIPSLIEIQDNIPDCGVISPMLYKRDMAGIDYNCARDNKSVKRLAGANFAAPFKWVFKWGKGNLTRQHLLRNSDLSSLPEVIEIVLPSGSCMLMDKDLMQSIGSFDPMTFLYYEENILAAKLGRRQLRNFLATNLRCIHLGATTTAKSPSKRILKAGLDSQRYYVANYSDVSWPMRMIYMVSYWWMRGVIAIKCALKGH